MHRENIKFTTYNIPEENECEYVKKMCFRKQPTGPDVTRQTYLQEFPFRKKYTDSLFTHFIIQH